METGEVIYERVYASPRPPPKISLKHDWRKDLGSEVARQPEREVARQAKKSQSSQPNPNPDHDRTEKPVVCPQTGAHHSQEIETRSFREEAVKHDRTVKPVVCRDENHKRPTLVCSEQASHPRFFREGQNLIFEDEINHDRTVKPVVYPQDGGLQRRFSRDSTNFKGETNHDRTEKPVVCRDISHAQGARKTSRSQEIETRSFNEEAVNHDGTGTPAVGRDTSHEPRASQTRSSHESTTFNVGDETNHDRTERPVVGRDASH